MHGRFGTRGEYGRIEGSVCRLYRRTAMTSEASVISQHEQA